MTRRRPPSAPGPRLEASGGRARAPAPRAQSTATRPLGYDATGLFIIIVLGLYVLVRSWGLFAQPFLNDDYVFLNVTRDARFTELWNPARLPFHWYRPISTSLYFWAMQHLWGLHALPFLIVKAVGVDDPTVVSANAKGVPGENEMSRMRSACANVAGTRRKASIARRAMRAAGRRLGRTSEGMRHGPCRLRTSPTGRTSPGHGMQSAKRAGT